MSARPERFALLVRVTGDPKRLTDEELSTFADMVREVQGISGSVSDRLLLVDRSTATLVYLSTFDSRAALESRLGRTRTAIEVAGVLIGGDPGASTIETFEIVTAAPAPG
jgi:hypothetical protein